MVRECVKNTMILFEATPAPAGEMPVVLAAGSSGILLHEAIGHGMEADFNRKNVSIYSDKIGKLIAKPFVNIVDEGTQEHARGAINVDDEGTVAGKTMLVQDGVLTTYLHDKISAKHYGVAPTGNGRRESYQHSPMPRMRSTYMLPGPHKRDEIIASVKKGIYCTRFTNGQVQIGAGDFTFYVKNGFLIEDGKLTRPIKDVNIIGNGPEGPRARGHGLRRPRHRRGRLDLRQERPVGPRLPGPADRPRRLDHRRRQHGQELGGRP